MAKSAAKLKSVESTEAKPEVFSIEAPDMRVIEIEIEGTESLMINRFSSKMKDKMLADHVEGSAAKQKGKVKPPKDVKALFNGARYICTPPSGAPWDGVLAASFRNALIRTCSVVGFKMTAAKHALFIVADGRDDLEKLPVVKIISKPPAVDERPVRNANGSPDIRIRPRYDEWRMVIRVRYDADIFKARDVVNLMMRAGMQNGIGEGRVFSKSSNGIGLGSFKVIEDRDVRDKVVSLVPKKSKSPNGRVTASAGRK